MDEKRKPGIFLNALPALLFVAAILFVTIRYGPQITRLMGDLEQFADLLNSYGYKSVIVFILFQILQVVIAAIPGEVIQIAGGYVYGTLPGTLYLVVGVIIGSVIVFHASRLLGYPFVRTFVPQSMLEKFDFLVNSSKSEIAVFILFLIPGIPKDILTYIAGLTPLKPARFLLIATVARFPALLASAYIGANLQERNYKMAIALSIAAVILFGAGILLKDRVIRRLQDLLRRRNG